jgi:hypothetical protein
MTHAKTWHASRSRQRANAAAAAAARAREGARAGGRRDIRLAEAQIAQTDSPLKGRSDAPQQRALRTAM